MLVDGLCELLLYRLASRLGMHLSRVAQQYVAVEYFLRGASAIGFALLNFSAILVFLVLLLLLFYKMNGPARPLDGLTVSLVSLLLALTIAFLLFPPGMLGAVAYNGLTFAIIWTLAVQYWLSHPARGVCALVLCCGLGVSSWLYYHISSRSYGLLGMTSPRSLVHEISRLGEALVVAATGLVFVVYAGFT